MLTGSAELALVAGRLVDALAGHLGVAPRAVLVDVEALPSGGRRLEESRVAADVRVEVAGETEQTARTEATRVARLLGTLEAPSLLPHLRADYPELVLRTVDVQAPEILRAGVRRPGAVPPREVSRAPADFAFAF